MKKVFFSLATVSLFVLASCSSDKDCECKLKSDTGDVSKQTFTTDESNCYKGLVNELEEDADGLFDGNLSESAVKLLYDCEEK